MMALKEEFRAARRMLFLHDVAFFIGLTVITIAMFFATLFLFRSFSSHRVDLAERWYSRGMSDMSAHRPDQAVTSLRTALGYEPTNHQYQLALAEALGSAGDTFEAETYFLNLWEEEPGNGVLNLQLARLQAKRGFKVDAVHYYRSAIYGTWEGDGALRRLDVRLELIRYLMAQKDFGTARTELLIAAGNSPDDPGIKNEIAGLMMEADDPQAALVQYKKVLVGDRNNKTALEGAGQAAYWMGRYAQAERFLSAADKQAGGDPSTSALLTKVRRILELYPNPDLPESELARRVLFLRELAQNRLAACQAQLAHSGNLPAGLTQLEQRWTQDDRATLAALRRDSGLRQQEIKLAYDTEKITSQVCGTAQGDDAFVLLIANAGAELEQRGDE